MRLILLALMICHGACASGAVASGRNWRLSVESLSCEAADSLITVGARIRYLGPGGLVEAPVSQLVDGGGKPYLPKSMVWKSGSKPFAALLAAGGIRQLQSAEGGEIQFRFVVREPAGDLELEFGDIKAVQLTRVKAAAKAGLCESLLKSAQIRPAENSRAARADGSKPAVRVYRAAYPCEPKRGPWQTIEAAHPPYLPEQLLVFGRGYLPNARFISLPMGKAAAQSYAYGGVDALDPIEDEARRAILADFPALASGLAPAGRARYFAFNWGAQKAANGNDMRSIGVYALRPCAQ